MKVELIPWLRCDNILSVTELYPMAPCMNFTLTGLDS